MFTLDLSEDFARDQNAARIGKSLEPRGDVDALAVDIALLVHNHVTQIDTNAQLQRVTTGGELILNICSTSEGGNGASKFGQNAIARGFNQAPLVTAQVRLDNLPPKPPDLDVGGFLGAFHQGGIADNVGCQDRR